MSYLGNSSNFKMAFAFSKRELRSNAAPSNRIRYEVRIEANSTERIGEWGLGGLPRPEGR